MRNINWFKDMPRQSNLQPNCIMMTLPTLQSVTSVTGAGPKQLTSSWRAKEPCCRLTVRALCLRNPSIYLPATTNACLSDVLASWRT